MNRYVLLFLSALIVAPAWAAEEKASIPALQKPAEMQAAPVIQTSVVIELKGPAQSVAALTADLEKDASYKEAGCSSKPAKKSAKTATITCAKADSALMAFLVKNAAVNIHWTISGTAYTFTANSSNGCPAGCYYMQCPVGSGVVRCCKNNTPC